jgi:serine/threonine protein kinase
VGVHSGLPRRAIACHRTPRPATRWYASCSDSVLVKSNQSGAEFDDVTIPMVRPASGRAGTWPTGPGWMPRSADRSRQRFSQCRTHGDGSVVWCRAAPVATLAGTRIGAYRITQPLGAGGMSEVWVAEHALLGRRAAIKVLRAELSRRPEIVRRFFNEARAMTAIANPGVAQIFDFGFHVDGSAYIAMELLEGETLERRLRRLGAFAVPEALHVVRQVASALRAAHAHGIVHRDLKPDNIFLARDPEVVGGERAKLLDFGIAKRLDERSAMTTQESVILGTPAFMSPEQCRHAGRIDQRSDVYSLGCVLFTLVTGRPPFEHAGPAEAMAMHLCEPAPAPSRCADGIPAAVDQLVLRCLAKDPDERPTAGELATTINALFCAPRLGGTHGRASAPFSGSLQLGAAPAGRALGRGVPGGPATRAQRAAGLASAALLVSGVVWLMIVVLSRWVS